SSDLNEQIGPGTQRSGEVIRLVPSIRVRFHPVDADAPASGVCFEDKIDRAKLVSRSNDTELLVMAVQYCPQPLPRTGFGNDAMRTLGMDERRHPRAKHGHFGQLFRPGSVALRIPKRRPLLNVII